MVMSLHFANSSALFGVLVFIGAWKLAYRHQSLRPSYHLQAHFITWYLINVCFNGTVLVPCESGKGQGSLLPSISSSCSEEKKSKSRAYKDKPPWHKFLAFRTLWLLELSGQVEPWMVISHWHAFLLWVWFFLDPVYTVLYICMSCGSEFPNLCMAWKFIPFPFLRNIYVLFF